MALSVKQRSIKALIWSGGESFGLVALSFVTFLVMARALDPKDFGLVALASAFVFFFNLIANQGFSDAIVQRQSLEPEHLDSAFWCNLGLAVTLAAICLGGADAAASWLGEPGMAEVLRWLSLMLPLNAFAAIQMAILRRDIRFKELAVRTLAGRVIGALVGIGMALTGWGVWSLVAQQITGALLIAGSLWISAEWRPSFRFSGRHLKDLWSFGIHVSATQIVVAMGEQLLNLLIGAVAGSVVLGYFTVAWRMVEIIKSLISSAVYHVSFTAFAKLQNDLPAMQQAYLQSTRVSCLIGFPIGAGMAILAEPMVFALFGSKWAASVPLLQVLAVGLMIAFYSMFFSSLFRALGRPSWTLYTATANLVLGVLGVAVLAPFGILAITIAWAGRFLLLLPALVLLARSILELPATALLRPVAGPLAASVLMTAAIYGLWHYLPPGIGNIGVLGLAIPFGAVVYGLATWLLFPGLVRDTIKLAKVMVAPASKTPT